jgi:hypothetical protein
MSRHHAALVGMASATLLGCTATPARSTDFRVQLPDQDTFDETAAIEVTIHRGTCDERGEVVHAQTFARDRMGAAPSSLGAGSYTVEAVARDYDCGTLAEGCQPVELPIPEGEALVLTLGAPALTGPGCDAAACTCGGCDCTAESCDVPCPRAGDATACDDLLAGAVFCDGFERAPIDGAWGWIGETNGLVVRDADLVHRGLVSMRAETATSGGIAHVGKSYPRIDAGDVWARAYVYVPASSPVAQINLLHVGEGTSPYDSVAVGLHTPSDVSRANIYASESDRSAQATQAFPLDRWVCVQLHVEVSPAPGGAVHVYIDGEEQITLTGIDTQPSTGIDSLGAGVLWSPDTQPATVLYVDDVAVGTEPLPCDA